MENPARGRVGIKSIWLSRALVDSQSPETVYPHGDNGTRTGVCKEALYDWSQGCAVLLVFIHVDERISTTRITPGNQHSLRKFCGLALNIK